MTRPRLTLADLAAGLDSFGDRYKELDVFADDVAEIEKLRDGELPGGVAALDEKGRRFSYAHEEKTFILELSEDGIARLRRPTRPPEPTSAAVAGALAGAAIGSAATKKGDGWSTGLVLGLLAGAVLGSQKKPERVFTMRFDAETQDWVAYDGGLVPWMKSEFQGAS